MFADKPILIFLHGNQYSMKGKAVFTKMEANKILALIREKIVADNNEQKKIRSQIRKLGFYASDFGIGGGYTEMDFKRAVTIVEDDLNTSSIQHEDKTLNPIPNKPGEYNNRKERDEAYIINLCDKVLGLIAVRQYRFEFLRGDSGVTLPVDAYYPSLSLVIEYRELQHTEEVKFFNKRVTVSGVNRGEQRRLYDQRRRDVLPRHNIFLIEFDYSEFGHTNAKRLIINPEIDLKIIKRKLSKFI
jgi:hypothetical protein